MFFRALILVAAAICFSQTDPLTQAANTWAFQYRKAALGDVTHPYENGFSWDWKNNTGVVFGGHLGTYTNQDDNVLPDINNTSMTYLFSFSDNRFSKTFPMDRPAKRCGVKLCYDENLGLTLCFAGAHHGFFNGYLEPGMRLSGLAEEGRRSTTVPFQLAPWGFDGATRQWHVMRPLILHAPTNSSPYYGFSVNYAFCPEYGLCLMMPTQFNRVYAYSAYSNQWTLLPALATDPAYPPVETYPCVTYDLKHRKLVAFFCNSAAHAAWTYDVGTHSWTRPSLTGTPTAGSTGWNGGYSSMAYDRKNGVHIYLKSDGAETWALSLDNLQWISRSPTGAPASGGSMGEGLTYDPVRNVSAVYTARNDEVWTYKYGSGIAGRPNPPENLSAVSNANRLALSWTAPSSGTAPSRYRIFRAQWEDNKTLSSGIIPGPYVLIDSTTGLAWTDTAVSTLQAAGYFHSYYVSAVSPSGSESDPSAAAYSRLRVPQGLVATVFSRNRVLLRWKPSKEGDVAGYNLYRAQNAYPRQTQIKGNRLNSALITGTTMYDDNAVTIAPDTLAMYVVTVVNLLGKESGLSGFATTAADWPVNLWADTAHKTLTWSPPRNGQIAGYRIYESPVDTFDEVMEGYENKLAPIATVTDTFWSYASRSPVGAYKIRAINVLGQEGHFSDVFDIQRKDQDTIGFFRLDYMTERPAVDDYYDDLPSIRVEERGPARLPDLDALIAPNPLNAGSKVALRLARGAKTEVAVFNARGGRIAMLNNGELKAGVHHFAMNTGEWPSGVYFVRISSRAGRIVRAAVMLK